MKGYKHILIILNFIILILEVLDWFNPYMNFIGNSVSLIVIFINALGTISYLIMNK